MKKTEVIPFGKYKNQPLEVLSQDPQYMEWLTQQDWFKSRYQNIYTLVVNNFGTPQDTPEHNKLVSLFLDDDFLQKIVNKFDYVFCIDKSIQQNLDESIQETYGKKQKNENTSFNGCSSIKDIEQKRKLKEKILQYVTTNKDKVNQEMFYYTPLFENSKGSDVSLTIYSIYHFKEISFSINAAARNFGYIYNTIKLLIECKPVVGEDFPSVIRQCRTQKSNVLIIDEFTATSVTIEQVRKMFPDIAIILLNEIINDTARITS
jgi:hypothetical protein